MRLTLLLLLALAGLARADGDVVELRNGDRLSGTIKKMTDEKLVIETPYAKEITVDWTEVVALESRDPHIVRLKPDEFVTARFVRGPDGVYLESESLRSATPVSLEQVATIDVSPGAHWRGAVTALLAGTKGNTDTLGYGAGAELVRETDDDRLRFGGRTEYSEEEVEITEITISAISGRRTATTRKKSIVTARNTRGWTRYDYFLGPHWMVGGWGRLEHDRFQDIDLRTIVGGGPGYRFFDTKPLYLSVYAGLAYINENFISEEHEDRSFVSAALGDEFRWKPTDGLTVYQLLDVYPSLEDSSDVLWHAAAGVRQTLTAGLFVDFGVEDDYDTKPASGRKKNDFRYRAQLGYGF